jgi:hypothetical protein
VAGAAGETAAEGCWLLSLEINIAPPTIKAPITRATIIITGDDLPSFCPQHCLYFNPLPQVQALFRPVFILLPRC